MKKNKNTLLLLLSSGFGVGYIKYIPGTLASFFGIIIWFFLISSDYMFHFFLIILILPFSIFISGIAEKIYNKKDDKRIIIDEIVGIWISLAFLPKKTIILFFGFLLFRFFDIKKPLLINKIQKINGGIGIILDDVFSGILTNTILRLFITIYKGF
jgi:phosphatidylglycerophosphatase A